MRKYKTFCLIIILIGTSLLSACNKTNNSKNIDLDVLKDAMLSAYEDVPEMEIVDSNNKNAEDLFTNLSSLEYVKVEEYFYLYSSTGTADELAVIHLKNVGDVKDAQNTLEDHVENRLNLFKTYAPDEVATAEDTRIRSYGNYVIMIMSHNADKIEAICDDLLK